MKKLLCIVLLLLIGVVPAMAGDSQESVQVEHLMWDIPFGIGIEECISLVRESVDVELDTDIWGLDRLPIVYFSSPSHEFMIWDVSGELGADFDENGILRAIFAEGTVFVPIEGWEEEWNIFTDNRIQNLMEMLEKTEQKYGEMIGGVITIGKRDPIERSWKEKKYLLPLRNGKPDRNTLSDVFAEDANSLAISCYYRGGIYVGIALSRLSIFEDERDFGLEIGLGLNSEEQIYYKLYESGLREYPTRRDGSVMEADE